MKRAASLRYTTSMSPLDERLAQLRDLGRAAFIPFVTAGDPDLDTSERLIRALADVGADVIEIGFPFSDPVADGPVIQASYTRALASGLRVDDIFALARRITDDASFTAPLVGMVSYSLVYRRGPAAFVDAAKAAGFQGLIVPDLIAEEADDFASLCRRAGCHLILLVTPTTTPERAARIIAHTTGFVYCVSVIGITGERDRLPESLTTQLARWRAVTRLPLCVGFGISRPEQVRQLRGIADGVIVGSALIKRLESDGVEAALAFARELVAALRDDARPAL